MKRIVKWLFLLAVVGGLATAGSYAGARAMLGKLVGPNSPLSGLRTQFVTTGVPGTTSKALAWHFSYAISKAPNIARPQVWISPTGRILATRPTDLEKRLDAYRRSLEP